MVVSFRGLRKVHCGYCGIRSASLRGAFGVDPAVLRLASVRVRIPPLIVRQKEAPVVTMFVSFRGLRRGRDSNPRYPFGYTAFPMPHDRPLCHLSWKSGLQRAIYNLLLPNVQLLEEVVVCGELLQRLD
jgi:hypothetical protein